MLFSNPEIYLQRNGIHAKQLKDINFLKAIDS